MTESKPHYAPWERTEAEDTQFQNAMNSASPEKLSGFVSELLEEADRQEAARLEAEAKQLADQDGAA
jgi:hypothetical protein